MKKRAASIVEATESTVSSWPGLVERAFDSLGLYLLNSDWYGRENELVNLFAHSFLLEQPSSLMPSQLGIEVAVKQIQTEGAKALVRKDLVIWKQPNQTVWKDGAPTNDPAVVVEFKINDIKKCAPDVEWLRLFTAAHPGVIGYSVCGFIAKSRGVSYKRIEKGGVCYEASACEQ